VSDLSEYDRKIVEAAETVVQRWVDAKITEVENAPDTNALMRVVQAKREAQRPTCDFETCGALASQKVNLHRFGTGLIYRCAEHKVTVTALTE
jgi:hypothetical protein